MPYCYDDPHLWREQERVGEGQQRRPHLGLRVLQQLQRRLQQRACSDNTATWFSLPE